jgi:histidinol dehydrogenase
MMAIIPVYEDLEEARVALAAKRPARSFDLPPSVRETIRSAFGADLDAQEVVARVLADVRAEGDAAVRRYTLAFDRLAVDALEVSKEEIDSALEAVSGELRSALELAAERIRAFYERTRRSSWLDFGPDTTLGQLIVPLERVGLYAPGGRACYPSTVLMAAVPARVAGVGDLVLATPPGPGGRPTSTVLAAARIAGVDRVFRVGGAQAIAALAYGTESIPRVDKIVGPGNVFVVLAKQAVAGVVGIDGLAGPTETVLIADQEANAAWVAADMIAQAEHDPLAQSVLIATDRGLIHAVLGELDRQLSDAPRRQVVLDSFRARGAIVLVDSVGAGVQLANEHAPEHLCLSVRDPWSWLGKVRNAGGVFVGERSTEALGDYTAGPSHVMPTGGTARYASALSLEDFVQVVPVFSYDASQVRGLADAAMALARAEGLEGHAGAIEVRLNQRPQDRRSL